MGKMLLRVSFKTTENTEKPFKLSIPICNDRKWKQVQQTPLLQIACYIFNQLL